MSKIKANRLENTSTANGGIDIDSSGRVGIATSAPSTSLHVKGSNTNGKGQFIIQSASAGQEARMTFIDGSDDIAEITTNGNNLYFYNETATGAFQWYTNNTERMQISSAGYVTKGNQPAFTAHSSAGWLTATADNQALIFNTASFNTGSHYNTSTGVFTAPVAGKYLITINMYIDSSGTYSTVFYLQKNGATVSPGAASSPWNQLRTGGTGAAGDETNGWTYILDMAANDNFKPVCANNARFYLGHSHLSCTLLH